MRSQNFGQDDYHFGSLNVKIAIAHLSSIHSGNLLGINYYCVNFSVQQSQKMGTQPNIDLFQLMQKLTI